MMDIYNVSLLVGQKLAAFVKQRTRIYTFPTKLFVLGTADQDEQANLFNAPKSKIDSLETTVFKNSELKGHLLAKTLTEINAMKNTRETLIQKKQQIECPGKSQANRVKIKNIRRKKQSTSTTQHAVLDSDLILIAKSNIESIQARGKEEVLGLYDSISAHNFQLQQ